MLDDNIVPELSLSELTAIADGDTVGRLSKTLVGSSAIENPSVRMNALQELVGILNRTDNQKVINSATSLLGSVISYGDAQPELSRAAIISIGEWGKSQVDTSNKTLAINTVFTALKREAELTWERETEDTVKKDENEQKVTRKEAISNHDLAIEAIMKTADSVTVTNKDEARVVRTASESLGTFINYCGSKKDMTALPSTINKAIGVRSTLSTLRGVANVETLNIAPAKSVAASTPLTK